MSEDTIIVLNILKNLQTLLIVFVASNPFQKLEFLSWWQINLTRALDSLSLMMGSPLEPEMGWAILCSCLDSPKVAICCCACRDVTRGGKKIGFSEVESLQGP